MTSLIPLFLASTGVLHGLHGHEALPAVQHGQQSLLRPAAAGGRPLPAEPVVRVAPSAQIPNEHAGEGPNGHGCDAVSSTAGVSTNCNAAYFEGVCLAVIHDWVISSLYDSLHWFFVILFSP